DVVRAAAPDAVEIGLLLVHLEGRDRLLPRLAVPVADRAVVAGGPDVVRSRAPDRPERLLRRRGDDVPAFGVAARDVADRALVADGPDVVRAGAPDGEQDDGRLAVDLYPREIARVGVGRAPAVQG